MNAAVERDVQSRSNSSGQLFVNSQYHQGRNTVVTSESRRNQSRDNQSRDVRNWDTSTASYRAHLRHLANRGDGYAGTSAN